MKRLLRLIRVGLEQARDKYVEKETSPVDIRIDQIVSWVKKKKVLICQCSKAQIILNLAGEEISGKIIQFPEAE